MRIYTIENVDKLFLSPWCKLKQGKEYLNLFNYMQKKEVALRLNKMQSDTLLKFLEDGVEYEVLLQQLKDWKIGTEPDNIIAALLANGILE